MISEVKRFRMDYLLNGRLKIIQSDTKKLLSIKDPFMPENMRINAEALRHEIAHWIDVAEVRKQRSSSIDNELIQ